MNTGEGGARTMDPKLKRAKIIEEVYVEIMKTRAPKNDYAKAASNIK